MADLTGRMMGALQADVKTFTEIENDPSAMGQAVTGDRASYQYLVESIRKFPDQEAFLAMIRAAGFGQAKYRNLTMGVVALHSGWKL